MEQLSLAGTYDDCVFQILPVACHLLPLALSPCTIEQSGCDSRVSSPSSLGLPLYASCYKPLTSGSGPWLDSVWCVQWHIQYSWRAFILPRSHWMAAQPSAVSPTSPWFVPSANLLRLLSVSPPRPLTQLHPNTVWALGYITGDSSQVKGTCKDLCLERFNFCWSIYRDVRRVLLKVYGKKYFIGDRLISARIYFEMPIILKYLLLSKVWNII